ncbi:sodium:melibiose symporter (plasmid) [Saccharobesus litoralis]|uniref:Sodium:melibiose symporter n=1 Tax=Saccharobesus litoralis TaxID=2172099 RepID=A0A2S0VY77_9ALTE|nr:MFS transporter [Saccharobesus litoralis]AWB69164.1 sodium:melibiose symporter [Saccharobesus litoralis]
MVNLRHKIAIGSGFFALFFVGHGIGALAIPYYQMILGVDPFYLGIILTLPILISALLSPRIGLNIMRLGQAGISNRLGILAFGWGAALSFGLLWTVPVAWSLNAKLIYLLVVSVVFSLCATYLTIYIRSIAYNLADSAQNATHVMGFTSIFEKLGSIIYFWLFPMAQLSLFADIHMGMQWVGWLTSIGLIGGLATVAAILSDDLLLKPCHAKQTEPQKINTPQLSPSLHKRLIILLILLFIQCGLIGFCISFDFYILVYFVDNGDIGQGAFWKGVLSSAYAILGLISIPIVIHCVKRFGKLACLRAIYVISIVGGASKWFIYAPGNQNWLVLDALLGVWIWTAVSAVIPALLADICIEHKAKTQQKIEAFIASRQHFILQVSAVFAFLVSGLTLNSIGFDAANGIEQSTDALWLMRVILAAGSVIFSAIPLYFLVQLKKA